MTTLCSSPNYGYDCVAFSGYHGQSTWGYPVDARGHNCTNYAAYRLARNGAANPGNLGNASAWDESARAKGFAVNGTPAKGAIAQWDAGHVGYVEVVASNHIETTDDSWGGTTARRRYYKGQADWPNHFIHIKDVVGSQPPPAPAPRVSIWRSLAGDFNGDNVDDIVLWRVNTGIWYIKYGPAYSRQVTYDWAGTANFQPFAGDFNGDGIDDIALRKISTGVMYIRYGPTFAEQDTYAWAATPDFKPFAGDFNGDGIDDLGLWRVSTGVWYIKYGPAYSRQVTYDWAGTANFQPVPGDFNGDGIDDLALRKVSTGAVYIKDGPTYASQRIHLWAGTTNFQPLAGDFNGDNVDDLALRKLSTGVWYIRFGPRPNFGPQMTYAWAAH